MEEEEGEGKVDQGFWDNIRNYWKGGKEGQSPPTTRGGGGGSPWSRLGRGRE